MNEPVRLARVLTVGLLAIAASVPAEPAGAQVLYGSIVGGVTDSQGAIVPGAHRDDYRQGNQPRTRDGHDRGG